jgi:glycogen synthase
VQTIHNSFDSAIPWRLLTKIEGRSSKPESSVSSRDRLTAYQIGLQLVDAPVTTVSKNFAKELTSDILQTEYYAPHLQNILIKNKTIGINNGMFTGFSTEFPLKEKHTIEEVQGIKLKNRKKLLKLLTTYKPDKRFGELTYEGRTVAKLPDEIPILIMCGRLDPVQKGYDILLQAIERFAIDEVKVILAPMPSAVSDLDYFYEVACKCRGNLTVFPFRVERGYNELQTGSTFGVMPSIYEPFGAAVEYMASGTVNVGRATGGLVDQINETCGFLYKEEDNCYTLENLKAFIKSGNIVQVRKKNAFVKSMANNLYEMLKRAIYIYQNHPDQYSQLIINGFKKAREFSWETNVKQYYNVYKMISKS